MDALFIMMEEVHEGFYEELMKLAVQYGYSIKKATYGVGRQIDGNANSELFFRHLSY